MHTPDDMIEQLAKAVYKGDLGAAEAVLGDMLWTRRYGDLVMRARKAVRPLPEQEVAPLVLPWPQGEYYSTLWDMEHDNRVSRP